MLLGEFLQVLLERDHLGFELVDGGLIGGAALKAPDFLSILAAASR